MMRDPKSRRLLSFTRLKVLAIVIAVVAVVEIAACVPVPPPGGSTLVTSADASVNSGAHATNYGVNG